MPTRHISTQSFDEILSDLGDDPAIPDPHGIRKPHAPKNNPSTPLNQGKNRSFTEPLNDFQIQKLIPRLGNLAALMGVLLAGLLAYFVASNAADDHAQTTLEESKKSILELKKEMSLMRAEIEQDQDDLYLLIEKLEVSIHSLKDKKSEIRVFSKPQAPNHETELRRWRYLGTSQMGASQQAYFHSGKNYLVFEKGAQALGEWRLSNIEKEFATFTHPLGKSLALKASKSE